jgi:hypothetical protein
MRRRRYWCCLVLCDHGRWVSFWTDKIVSKLRLARCYLFLYFMCDVSVLEPRSVNFRLLPDQGGNSLAQCRGTPVAFVADALAVDRACRF